MIVTCKPTGMSFKARRWVVGDIAALSKQNEDDEKKKGTPPKKEEGMVREMVSLVDEGVVDPGPYKDLKPGEKVNWDMVISQDLYAAALFIRMKTKRVLEIRPVCEYCDKLVTEPLGFPLDEVVTYEASEEGLECIKTEEAFIVGYNEDGDCIVPLEDGSLPEQPYVTVGLRPIYCSMLGTLDILQAQDKANFIDWQIVSGIEFIQLGDGPEARGNRPVMDVFEKLPLSIRDGIDRDQQTLFGGPDFVLDWTCDKEKCGREQETFLPLGPGFFGVDPRERLRRKKRNSSLASLRRKKDTSD